MRAKINLPGDVVHSIVYAYGRLLLPIWPGRWLYLRFKDNCALDFGVATRRRRRLRVVRTKEFHNCSATGVF